ncbi:DUF11 domain-containing protein, partial [Erysipelotrichaceae bacterium OttesenSCG-928-M19]|nr:DUF11 domain-containing protein [Erysipelotrichaceae bacterium OttesenSCG-928-M19]
TKVAVDENEDEKASPGETITYTITASNTGTANANNVEIKDDMATLIPYIENGANPENIEVQITSNKDTEKNGAKTLADLIAGLTYTLVGSETVTIEFTVTVLEDLDVSEVTAISNKATVGDTTPEVILPTGKADLSATKDVADENGDGKASPSETLSYTITTTNSGTVVAEDTVIKDTLDSVIPYIENGTALNNITVNVESSIDGKLADATLQDLVGGLTYDIAATEVITITFDVVLSADLDVETVTKISNIATFNGEEVEKEIPTGKPSVGGTKTVVEANDDKVASPGEVLSYTITSVNAGDADANDVLVKDTLENVIPYIENGTDLSAIELIITGSDTTKSEVTTLDKLVAGLTYDLKPQEELTFEFEVTLLKDLDVTKVKTISNIAVIGDVETEVEIETGEANVAAKKEVLEGEANNFASPGEELTYIITANNTGDARAEGILIKDTLDNVLPYIKEDTTGKVTVTSNLDESKNKDITLADLIAGYTVDLEANETIVVEFTVTISSTLDVMEVTSIANKAVVGDNTPEIVIPTGQVKKLSGIVYEDTNYDHLFNDGAVISGVKVYLVDSATDAKVATATTDVNGYYSFDIKVGAKAKTRAIVDGSGSYYLMIDEQAGYMVSEQLRDTRDNSSIVSHTTLKSNELDLAPVDLTNHHIGLAKDIVVSVAPDKHTISVNGEAVSNINLNYGQLLNVTVDNKAVEFEVVDGVINIKGVEAGQGIISLEFEDNYGRKVVTKTVTVTVEETKAVTPPTPDKPATPKTGMNELYISLIVLVAGISLVGLRRYHRN